mgnify:CR=1 FL=1
MSWSRCRFGDVVEVNPKVHLETGVEYPFLPMEDIVGGRKYNPPTQTRIFDKSGGSRFANDDTVLARITPCLENGKASKVKGLLEGVGFGSTEFFVFRAVKDLTDPDFVYYLAISDIIRQPAIKSMVGASGRQRADKGVVENIIFNLPDLPTQRRIASILSAYDDLIENNNRRIALLEESMRLLYREWFVRLRFPGHEHVRVIDGLPEGWERTKLRDVTSYINRGVSPKYGDSDNRWVLNQKCVREGRLNTLLARQHITEYSIDKGVKFGDVLVNSTGIGTLGRVAQVYEELENYTVDSHITIVRPNERVEIDYFGLFLLGLQPYFEQMGAGSTGQTELSRDSIANANFILPTIEVQKEFGNYISSQRQMIQNLLTQNIKLSEARDLLLPRLMSGEIDVS